MTTTRGESHILIVDDDETNLDILRRRLEREGYRVTMALDGQHALNAVGSGSGAFNLVLLDVMMPGIDGVEALRRLRQTHSQVDLPVIMVTAKDSSEDVVLAFKEGANDYVTKPIDFPVLFARMRSALRLSYTHQQLEQAQQSLVTAARAESIGQIASELAKNVQHPFERIESAMTCLRDHPHVGQDAEVHERVQEMDKALQETRSMVQRLTRFAAGHEMNPQPTQLNAIVSHCVSMLSSHLDLPGLDLNLQLADDLPEVSVDRDQMENAVLNVLFDAMQNLTVGGALDIRTDAHLWKAEPAESQDGASFDEGSNVIELQIADSGPAIQPSDLENVFYASSGNRGGVGLAVAKHIVEQHGGRIALQNRGQESQEQVSPLQRAPGKNVGVKAHIWLPATAQLAS